MRGMRRLTLGLVVFVCAAFVLASSASAATGELDFVDDYGGVDGPSAVSPDGDHVYAFSGVSEIVIFARDSGTGRLERIGSYEQDFEDPDDVELAPDGRFLYVAAEGKDAVVVLARDPSSGSLSFVGQTEATPSDPPSGLAVSSDGDHLYAISFKGDSIAVYDRDELTGTLTFVERLREGENGAQGLNGASVVALPPDGESLYVTGKDAVAAFRRNPTTGRLEFLQLRRDGKDGVKGLECASGVAASLDDDNVYATGFCDDSVAVFKRKSSGRLRFLERQRDGRDGVKSLEGAAGLAVAPDGKSVYATGRSSDSVVAFRRDRDNGRLEFLARERDGRDGVKGLGGPNDVEVSPDKDSVYVQAKDLVAFDRERR